MLGGIGGIRGGLRDACCVRNGSGWANKWTSVSPWVEARDRVGGRVHTDADSFSVPVDMGASIITGRPCHVIHQHCIPSVADLNDIL